MDETHGAANGDPPVCDASEAAGGRRGMMIYDGCGGKLWLDLSCGALWWLADACRRLISQDMPPGASMLKVSVASQVYLVSRAVDSDNSVRIRVANVFDPGERVALSCDLAEMVVALIGEATQKASHQAALATS
jgi:hypothetical protein